MPGPSLEAMTAARGAGPPRARACGSATPCSRTRSATRCSSPRPRRVLDHVDRRPVRPRPRRRLVRGRARAVRDRRCRRSASGSTASSPRSTRSRRCSRRTPPAPPGVTRDDPFYPLRGATNLPPPLTPGGPPIYLGGQRPRGIRLAARRGAGWLLPGTERRRRRLLPREARPDPRGARERRAGIPRRSSSWARWRPVDAAAGRARSRAARRIVAAGATHDRARDAGRARARRPGRRAPRPARAAPRRRGVTPSPITIRRVDEDDAAAAPRTSRSATRRRRTAWTRSSS